ncbi:MAG: GNAT family N-acetyltransferase [Gammaproteobacteria bacterium]|nr:GNAT family N-acetyltransferase [Gammaproteobacteria bacterium]
MKDSDTLVIRRAESDDLPAIVTLLADDPLGAERERAVKPLPESYVEAFERISGHREVQLLVVEIEGVIAGTGQLNYLTYLTYQGGTRAQIEAVRVHKDYRHHGVGALLINEMISLAKRHGCHVIQLTSDKKRPEALEFYEKLGFVASHEGLKQHLQSVIAEY